MICALVIIEIKSLEDGERGFSTNAVKCQPKCIKEVKDRLFFLSQSYLTIILINHVFFKSFYCCLTQCHFIKKTKDDKKAHRQDITKNNIQTREVMPKDLIRYDEETSFYLVTAKINVEMFSTSHRSIYSHWWVVLKVI